MSIVFFLFLWLSLGKTITPLANADFPLVNGTTADLYVDTNDWAGLKHAVDNLKSDINLVASVSPTIRNSASGLSSNAVIIGSIGKSTIIDDLISKGTLDVSEIKGKWESYIIKVVQNPVSGVSQGLVIVGSDKRGAIYGVYRISEIIGVSPFIYWADSVPFKQKTLLIPGDTIVQGEPSVKYRGIFLNDESPALSTFVKQFGSVSTQGSAGYNHNFYTKVFDMILRCKGNYLWPAMWNNAFWIDDTQNPILADEYGIVMGTTHQEFLVSSDKEWSWANKGSWNYLTNKQNMIDFWTKNVAARKNFENVYTMGMRGQNDQAILPSGSDQENIDLLNQVVQVQREILTQVNNNISTVPQMVTLYKEVEEFYYKGWNKIIADDVILVLCDDNHGNLRSLPTAANRNRTGGFGMYYHFDYHGSPRGYRWINTSPAEKTREQMMMAYNYGIRKLWIVNVGDLKPNEVSIEYWFKLAYDVKTWGTLDGPERFYKQLAEREFGAEHADEVANILHTNLQINNIRKPEIVSYHTFHATKFDESTTLLNRYMAASTRAQELYDSSIPTDQKNAFYFLVLYGTRASANVFKLMIYLGLNKEYATQGRYIANWYSSEAQAALDQDNKEMSYMNKEIDNGKWNGFGAEYHIGQTTWDPRTSQFSFSGDFALSSVSNTAGAEMIVIPRYASGSSAGKKTGTAVLPTFHSFAEETHYVDIANTKNGSFTFTATPSASWIKLNQTSGTVTTQVRLEVSLDWANVPSGGAGTINITGNSATVTVNVTADVFNATVVLPTKTYIETEGYVSILSKNYANSVAASDGAKWQILPNYGREESSVKVQPDQLDSHRTPGSNAPYLEYNVYITTPGDIDIVTQWAPTTGPDPDYLTRLRYGISFNNDSIQTIHTMPPDFKVVNEGGNSWAAGVENAVRTATIRDGGICYSKHTVSAAGLYTLRVYMVDDGLVLHKILVGTKSLERANTNSRSATVSCNPTTREKTSTTSTTTIAAVSLPKIFIGSQQSTGASYDTYFGPPETAYTNA
jgi:hypothetical protein